MTVAELIAELQRYPSDHEVVIPAKTPHNRHGSREVRNVLGGSYDDYDSMFLEGFGDENAVWIG